MEASGLHSSGGEALPVCPPAPNLPDPTPCPQNPSHHFQICLWPTTPFQGHISGRFKTKQGKEGGEELGPYIESNIVHLLSVYSRSARRSHGEHTGSGKVLPFPCATCRKHLGWRSWNRGWNGWDGTPSSPPWFSSPPQVWDTPTHTDTRGASSELQGPQSSRRGWTRVLSPTSLRVRGASYPELSRLG